MYLYRYKRTNTYRTYLRATNTFAETHAEVKHGIFIYLHEHNTFTNT